MSRNSFYSGDVNEVELIASSAADAGLAQASATAAEASAAAAAAAGTNTINTVAANNANTLSSIIYDNDVTLGSITSNNNSTIGIINGQIASIDASVALVEGYVTGIYLGAQGSDPELDNAGDPLVQGVWYFNTNSHLSMIYNGTGFQPTVTSTHDMLPRAGGVITGNITTAGSSCTDYPEHDNDENACDLAGGIWVPHQTFDNRNLSEDGALLEAHTDAIAINSAKTGITTTQRDNILANNNKTGITITQRDNILTNNNKVTVSEQNLINAGAAMLNGAAFTGAVSLTEITENVVTLNTADSFTPILTNGTIFVLAEAATVNMPTLALGKSFTVVVNTGTDVTWNGTIYWNDGTLPDRTSGTDTYVFICPDGSKWLGSQSGTSYSIPTT